MAGRAQLSAAWRAGHGGGVGGGLRRGGGIRRRAAAPHRSAGAAAGREPAGRGRSSPGGPCRCRPLPRASVRLPLSGVRLLSVSLFARIRLPLFEGCLFLAGKRGGSRSYLLPRAQRAAEQRWRGQKGARCRMLPAPRPGLAGPRLGLSDACRPRAAVPSKRKLLSCVGLGGKGTVLLSGRVSLPGVRGVSVRARCAGRRGAPVPRGANGACGRRGSARPLHEQLHLHRDRGEHGRSAFSFLRAFCSQCSTLLCC